MDVFGGFVAGVRRIFSGETLATIDTAIPNRARKGTLSLRLKRAGRSTADVCVVLACLFAIHRRFIPMSPDEFDAFAGGVQRIRRELDQMLQASGQAPVSGADLETRLTRVMSPEALVQQDTPVWNGMTVLSLRLKRDPTSSSLYIVLAYRGGGGMNWFYRIGAVEYFAFADAVQSVRERIRPLVHPSLQQR